MKVQRRRLSFPLLVLTASLTLAPATSRAQLVPPGDFRGKSLAQWTFDWTEWGLKTGLGGQTLPDTVDGVRYLPPNLGSTFVTSLTIQQGTAVVFAPFIVFGENYDNGTSDNPADPILNDIFADVTIQTMFDGATVLQGSGNAFPDRKYGPTSFAAPIVYTDPQPRGPGLNSVAAIFGLGIGAIFDPLPLGQHTIQNVYTSNFFGGTFSATYNITAVPEPASVVLVLFGLVLTVVARPNRYNQRCCIALAVSVFTAALLSAAANVARAEAPYNVEWSRQIDTTADDGGFGVAVDAAGNAYISGNTYGSLGGPNAGGEDAFLSKYDGAGNLLWSRQIGTTAEEVSFDVAVDAAGNAYISGFTSGSLGGPHAGGTGDAFLTKYDGAGDLLWSRQIGTTDYDLSRGVAVDAAGNAYISGYTEGSLGGPNAGGIDAFLTKYDGAGNLLWSRQFGTTDDDNPRRVAVDAAGNAYISASTQGSLGGPNAGGWDAFLTKYDGAGNLLWSRQFGTTDDDYGGGGVAVDAAGNAYMSGTTVGDAFLTKYDGAGNLLWSRQFGTTTLDISRGVAVDAAGNAYITGFTFGSLGGPNAGENDAFLTKYDGAGNLLWSGQIGTSTGEFTEDVAVDAVGNAYIGGSTYSGFGNGGPRYAFLVKFSVPEPSSLLLLAAFVVAGLLNSRRSLR